MIGIQLAVSIGALAIAILTLAGAVLAAGKLIQRLDSHEQLDIERHEATTEMFKEIRSDIKLLLMTKQ